MRPVKTLALLLAVALPLAADEPSAPAPAAGDRLVKTLPGLTIDLTKHQVIADAAVCLREGALEFAACSPGTKEHESLLVIGAQPKHLHLALLLAGLRPGSPVKWVGDTFVPPTGDRVNITLRWQDPEIGREEILSMSRMGVGDQAILDDVAKLDGRLALTADDMAALADGGADAELLAKLKPIAEKWMARRATDRKTHEAPLYDWVRSSTTKKTMPPTAWVFVGSRTLPDGTYWADTDGTMVTVSNFESAVLDVPMRSTDKNEDLLWEANTPAIPPAGTKVEMVFAAAEPPGPKQMTIQVAADGTMKVKDKAVTAGELEKIFGDLSDMDRKYVRVVIEAAPQTPFKQVVQVLDLLTEAGIARINFSLTQSQQ